ncbi:MAG: hypothetical protein HY724_03975, partial [Candidatus Rokubacteria bacterium]|nr:hypothetical protein [Candidatus Rokubacteria bacterium]
QMPPLPSLLKRLDLFNLRLFLSNRARERMLEAMGGNAAVPALRDVVIQRSMLRQSRGIIGMCRKG